MSSYTGLYVYRTEHGKVNGVQVSDPNGNSIHLDVETYLERRIKPPIEELPNSEQYNSKQK